MPLIDNLYYSYPDQEIFRNLNLNIPVGSISCILGPSGCGKTTLLNLICGIIKPLSGEIRGFKDSSFSYIFQETRILPWKTVYQNIAFPLKDKMDQRSIEEKTRKFMELVELTGWKEQ